MIFLLIILLALIVLGAGALFSAFKIALFIAIIILIVGFLTGGFMGRRTR